MRYRALDANGDYVIGQPFLANTPECVRQAVVTRLKLWRGEFFANLADGTPWLQEILGPRAASTPDAAIKDRMLGTTGVTGLAAYDSSYNPADRSFTVTATLNTVYGTIQLTEALT